MDAVAFPQPFGQQVAQVPVACEVFGRLENGIMQPAELDLEVAFLRDLQRVPSRFGDFGKARFHLLGRAQVKLFLGIPEPPGVGQLGLCADADQAIMGMGVAFLDIVNVVGRHQLQAEFLRPGNQMPVHLRLFGKGVVLQFQVEILRPQRLLEPVDRLAGLRQLPFEDRFRDFACQAAGQGDQPLLVRRQQFFVDSGLVIVTFEMRRRGEAYEVLVAGFILGQQHEVMVRVAAARAALFLQAAARRHVNLAADDRRDALLPRGLIKINGAVEHAVVGDGDGGEFQRVSLVHQPVEPARSIEQGILGVEVQMDKIRVRHALNLPPFVHVTQGSDIHRVDFDRE